MSIKQAAGFIEIPHTADWAVQVWAPQYCDLLVQAALALYSLTETRLASSPCFIHRLDEIEGDRESMLVAFLSELIYLSEMERKGFDQFSLDLSQGVLRGELEGGAILNQSREIKAVTYHELAIRETPTGLVTTIVFDV